MFSMTSIVLNKKITCSTVSLLLVLIILIPGGSLGSGNVFAASVPDRESAKTTGSHAADPTSSLITINMVDTDVRNVLSAIALYMDANIIYLGTPAKVTFNVSNVTPVKALELLTDSITAGKGQLGCIREGNVIIIGEQDKLQKEFFNQMALTRFRVSYISPKVLGEQLDKLNIPVAKITLDKSSNFIWVQGTPKALAKVASVISALDKCENFDTVDGTIHSSINLKPVILDFITAEEFDALVKQLKIDVSTIKLDTCPNVLWASGSQQGMLDIDQLAQQVDIPQSKGEVFSMTHVKLKNLTYNKLITIVSQLNISVQVIRVGSGQRSLWLKGIKSEIDELNDMITKLDIPDNGDEVQFFTYTLKNISPSDAQARLQFLGINSVDAMVLNVPQLAHELLIKCPFDMIGTVTKVLGNIDIQGQKIKAPVDSATSAYQLTKRKELLCKLMDIPAGNLIISDNISRDGSNSYYIMWTFDTPDNIKKIKEMAKLMDAP